MRIYKLYELNGEWFLTRRMSNENTSTMVAKQHDGKWFQESLICDQWDNVAIEMAKTVAALSLDCRIIKLQID